MPTSHGAALGVAGVKRWIAGTYGLDAVVWSPMSRLTYIRIVAGGGSTDPAEDGANWALFGPSRIRSIRRGVIAYSTDTGTATLSPAVDVSKCELRDLGASIGSSGSASDVAKCRLTLTNSTTITSTRNAVTGGAVSHSYELTEWW